MHRCFRRELENTEGRMPRAEKGEFPDVAATRKSPLADEFIDVVVDSGGKSRHEREPTALQRQRWRWKNRDHDAVGPAGADSKRQRGLN